MHKEKPQVKTKFLEIRDRGTCIPVMAQELKPTTFKEIEIFRRYGWGEGAGIILTRLDNVEATNDPYQWNCFRTMRTAHNYINSNFDTIPNYSVVDVRVILGETTEPAQSEIWTIPFHL